MLFRVAVFLVSSFFLVLSHSANAMTTGEELYKICQLFQASKNKSLFIKMSSSEMILVGRCAGFVEAFPSGYMFGHAVATQTPASPGCYQPAKTTIDDVIGAIMRRYERSRVELKNRPAEVLMLLALRDELPCKNK